MVSATITTTVEQPDPSKQLASFYYGFEILLTVVVTLEALFFAGYICRASGTMKTIRTQKNLLLFVMILCEAGYFLSSAEYDAAEVGSIGLKAASIFQAVCFAVMLIFYLWYSWLRSVLVFEQNYSARALKIVHVLLWVATGITLIPPLIEVLPLDRDTYFAVFTLAMGASAVVVLIVDTFYGVCYLQHLFRKTAEVVEAKGEDAAIVTTYFQIIAKYGAAATFFSFAALGTFAGSSYMQINKPTEISDKIAVVLVILLNHIMIASVGLSLILMKVRLIATRRLNDDD
ncbi:hypothetical protein BCR33DRAFT_526363 [Rhizoclosmatium globosum]|uniref:Uncharacterized protein n=1 Tax=Rhizoclosmatium globosum TaxID=329046 RepID=A0A1Y2CTU3_9FUNG|nr:hypothetical protein BCR33DRAFT_526363 [Rhizoclosmatium globosum]|eukprot:ORY50316.1 hypothetical protein BCR33DRAFT_526363 [Rhizoclosmatium globosum]